MENDRELKDRVVGRSNFAPKIKEGYEQYHSTEMLKNSLSRLQNKMVAAPSECGEELQTLKIRFDEVMTATDYLPKGTLKEVVEGIGYLEAMKEAESVLHQGKDAKSILESMRVGIDGAVKAKIEDVRELKSNSNDGPNP